MLNKNFLEVQQGRENFHHAEQITYNKNLEMLNYFLTKVMLCLLLNQQFVHFQAFFQSKKPDFARFDLANGSKSLQNKQNTKFLDPNSVTSFLGIVHHYLFGDNKANWKSFLYFHLFDKYFVDYTFFVST